MAGTEPKVELVPWDFDSEEHRARMYQQRLACGWRSEEVEEWADQGRAGRTTLYWIVCIPPSSRMLFRNKRGRG